MVIIVPVAVSYDLQIISIKTMVLKIQNEVKSTQKQPSCKKKNAALKRLGEKVVKSKVAAMKLLQ